MTILQVASGNSIYGGEKILLSLAGYLRNKNHRLIILSPGEGALVPWAKRHGYKTVVMPLKKTYNLMAVARLALFIKSEKVDIVHSHGLLVNIISRLASFLAGCKCVNTIHVIQHLTDSSSSLGRKIKNIYYRSLDNFTARFCQKIMAVSQAVEKDLLRQGLAKKKITTIPNGLEEMPLPGKEKKLLRPFGVAGNDKVVGLVGRIVPLKGHDDLITAAGLLAAQHPGIKFLIVGEDLLKTRYSQALKERVVREGLERQIVFTGFIDSIREIMAAFDILALPSWEEPFGLVILEAMSAGVPVIAARAGGIPEIIKDGQNGLLIPPHSPQALSQAILRIIQDDFLAERISREGLKTVKDYSLDKMAKNIEDIYYEVLEES